MDTERAKRALGILDYLCNDSLAHPLADLDEMKQAGKLHQYDIASKFYELREEILALLALVESQGAVVEAARPFADPYSWHHNHDGGGIIFQPDGAYYESQQQAYIDAVGAALAALVVEGE